MYPKKRVEIKLELIFLIKEMGENDKIILKKKLNHWAHKIRFKCKPRQH